MSLQPGSSFGPYEILAAIGAGGMGEVYRARDTRLGRDVAIKTLPESLATDPERLARFRRQAETLAAPNHPNIATIFGLEEIDGVLALAMELVEGPTLADRLARPEGRALQPAAGDGFQPVGSRGLPPDEALPLAKQLALALEAAHERGIIHRDLKPANIKLTADGSLKLLDFGLAKALDPSASGAGGAGGAGGFTASPTISVLATQSGVLLGTAAYMSPEQVRGSAVDKRADIWAFGVVVYEMLTGRGLFGGDTISDTLAGVLREPIDLEKLPASTPRAIRQLIGRCLERDPRRRLRDIGEARIAIDDCIAQPQADVPAHDVGRDATPPWRRIAPWALSAILASAVVLLALRARPQVAADADDVASFDFALDGLMLQRGGVVGGFVAISPDGRRVITTAVPRESGQTESRSQQRLYQRTLDGGDFVAVPGTETSTVPFISPDGKWVGFESGGQLRKVAFAGGVAIRICDPAPTVGGATWMDDRTIVFAAAGQLFQVPDGGGVPRQIATAKSDGSTYSWPSAIRGRNAVLATLRTGSAGSGGKFRIVALDLQSGRETSVADGTYPRYVNGFVVYGQQSSDERSGNPFTGALLAVPFDVARLEPTGPPTAVATGVRVFAGGAGNYDVATNGTAVWVPGTESGQLEMAWLPLDANAGSRTAEPPLAFAKGGLVPRLSSDGRLVTYQVGVGALSAVFVGSLERGAVTRISFDGTAARPVFGPTAGMVTFLAGGTRSGLWAAAVDGGVPPERLTTSPHIQVAGAWSRDGAQLARP